MTDFFKNTPAAFFILTAIVMTSILAFKYQRLRWELSLHPYSVVRGKRLYTIVSHGFVHADLVHLMFNAVSYYSIAFALELVLGWRDFLIVYTGSMVLGTLPTLMKRRNAPDYRSLGASGAISGLFFSAMLFFPTSRIVLFFIPIGIPIPLFAVLFLVFSYAAAKRGRSPIAHDAHFYGAISGLTVTLLLRPDALHTFLAAVF